MHDEAAFLQAMQEHPDDVALRLVFADWLEERGDPRAELLRLLHTLTQAVKVPQRKRLENRLRKLVASGVKSVGPFVTNSIGMKFAWIPAGTFLMGSPAREEGRFEDESQHQVTLSQGYYLAIHPVTQASWRETMRENPSREKGENRPVEQVSWDDCQRFLRKLSERDGHSYRLPTEAEWEYACRAGTTTPYSVGKKISTDQANFLKRDTIVKKLFHTSPVGTFPANGWGLHDMHGNVWEWCADGSGDSPQEGVDLQVPPSENTRGMRGGSCRVTAKCVRSAQRFCRVPTCRRYGVGLRPVRL